MSAEKGFARNGRRPQASKRFGERPKVKRLRDEIRGGIDSANNLKGVKVFRPVADSVLRRSTKEGIADLFPDSGLVAKEAGKTALTLLSVWESERVVHYARMLGAHSTRALAAIIPDYFPPSFREDLPVDVVGMDVFGRANDPQIALLAQSPGLTRERRTLTRIMNEILGTEFNWRDYKPHITVAYASRTSLDPHQVAAGLRRKMPETVTLLPAETKMLEMDDPSNGNAQLH